MSSLIEPGKPATPPAADRSSAERERARKRLEKKNKLRGDLVAYVVINLAIIGVWALTGFGYFWPAGCSVPGASCWHWTLGTSTSGRRSPRRTSTGSCGNSVSATVFGQPHLVRGGPGVRSIPWMTLGRRRPSRLVARRPGCAHGSRGPRAARRQHHRRRARPRRRRPGRRRRDESGLSRARSCGRESQVPGRAPVARHSALGVGSTP